MDPELPELHNYLASLLGGTGKIAAAEKELRSAIRILPGIPEWRLNLARLLASRGAIAEARYHFERAIRLKADGAVARLDYAWLLASLNRNNEAEKQAKAAVEDWPTRAERRLHEVALNVRNSGERGDSGEAER